MFTLDRSPDAPSRTYANLLTTPTCQTLDELRDKLDQSLFRSAKYNPDHVLHRHLPPRKQTGYNLRDKSHNLTFPKALMQH